MSIQGIVSDERRQPSPRLLTRQTFRLGSLLREAVQAYADAVSMAYTIMLGLDRAQKPWPHDRDY